ncbi:MAG: alanyl-tRNA editing protein, partial [Candidatus Micrarchaeota archaeon]
LRECHASVISAEGKEIVLDRTVFYPRGGGQPGDRGTMHPVSGIASPASGLRVVDVYKKEGRILHQLETGDHSLKPGDGVKCVLDWGRRYKLMRMHTAAHVLGAIMHDALGILISGNQLEEDKTRFDFTMSEFDRTKFEMVVAKANEALSREAELKIYSLPREEAMKIPGVVKLAGALPPSISTLRIVEIPGIDVQADGGTHVRSLSEVGKIEILRLDNKGRENRRIYFTLSP